MASTRIVVLDFGGQYAHLVCNAIRRLGVYAQVVPADYDPVQEKSKDFEVKGIVLSGGPGSVYESKKAQCAPELFQSGYPILGICYGMQLMVHCLGGHVARSLHSREYGPATLRIQKRSGPLASVNIPESSPVWMSHGDEISRLPFGFYPLASSSVCQYAAMGDADRHLYGLQFHPEVSHTIYGNHILAGFLQLCGFQPAIGERGPDQQRDYWQKHLQHLSRDVRNEVGDRVVICLVSGGVDSTVLFALLQASLPDTQKILAYHVDTGLLRKAESLHVQKELESLTNQNIHVLDRREIFLEHLKGVQDSEQKRKIIGRLFVSEQKKIIEKMIQASPLEVEASQKTKTETETETKTEKTSLGTDWCWAQGTIYPDTVESGMGRDQHTEKIKTHHNRVAEIMALQKENKLVEPLSDLYKDEVRQLGRQLSVPEALLNRHPFPGVGLAVRYICATSAQAATYHSFTFARSKREIPAHFSPEEAAQAQMQSQAIARTSIQNVPLLLDASTSLLPQNEDLPASLSAKLIKEEEANYEPYPELQHLQAYAELPLSSVGVQGDQRTVRKPLAITLNREFFSRYAERDTQKLSFLASQILNQCPRFNRILLACPELASHELEGYPEKHEDVKPASPPLQITSFPSEISQKGLDNLREADYLVEQMIRQSNVFAKIWQLAVIALPLTRSDSPRQENRREDGVKKDKDEFEFEFANPALANNRAFVIRAVSSVNAMTAEPFAMSYALLQAIASALREKCAAEMVFYDLSFKPPATIEWE